MEDFTADDEECRKGICLRHSHSLANPLKPQAVVIDYLRGNKRTKILRRLIIIEEGNGIIQELGSILRLSAKSNECDRS
jgi:hypothetical protein